MNAAGEDELLQAVMRHQLFLIGKAKHTILRVADEIFRQYEVPLDRGKEVTEHSNSPGVHCMDFVLVTESNGPDLVQTFHVHHLEAVSDSRVVVLKQ